MKSDLHESNLWSKSRLKSALSAYQTVTMCDNGEKSTANSQLRFMIVPKSLQLLLVVTPFFANFYEELEIDFSV